MVRFEADSKLVAARSYLACNDSGQVIEFPHTTLVLVMCPRASQPRSKAARKKPATVAPRKVLPASARYLRKTQLNVRSELGVADSLPVFLATAGGLTPEERHRIVLQALVVMEQNYVHLPLKKAMHAVEPLQRLRLLLRRLEETPPDRLPAEVEFHREMTEIFMSVRDLHTNYFLPAPFAGQVAFLPFMIADFTEDGVRKYLIVRVASGFSHPTFVPEVEVLHWNGAPIARAIWANAQRFAGSNLEARHARGVATMTTRPLLRTLPPDEEWVIVRFRTLAGNVEELRFDWMVGTPPALVTGSAGEALDGQFATALAVDVELEFLHRMRAALFRPAVLQAAEKAHSTTRISAAGGTDALPTTMPGVLRARSVDTPHGRFGYVGIRSFNTDPNRFVAEFVRLVETLPQNGLIVDVRGNGGGIIFAGEQLLQVLTPQPIEPETLQFLNTPVNLRLCRRHGTNSPIADLSPWEPSIQRSLETGAVFSNAFPLSSPKACNQIGQHYHGPVVLITDALCYSTTDIFAAGFQDHAIGPILGVDGNTGAGGANVWDHSLLSDLFARPTPDPASPYEAMPKGSSLRVAIRRTLRVGARAGTPVEDIGVVPEHIHLITRNDLVQDNVDLFAAAGALLAVMSVRELRVQMAPAAGNSVVLSLTTKNLDRIDVFVNRRPQHSIDLVSSSASIQVAKPSAAAAELRLEGYAGGQLAANRVLSI